MNWRTLTKRIIIAITVLAIVYDVIAWQVAGSEATISRVVLGWSLEMLPVVFAAGFLCGHLFWPQVVRRS